MSQQPRKDLLVKTACRLFNEHGYHATGIDRIMTESGVSKATLYKHFRSKEDLILAVLNRRHDELDALTREYLATPGAEASQPVLRIFDALHDWFQTGGFFGCNFIKASTEYGAEDDPIHKYAAQHKESLRKLIREHITAPTKKQRNTLSEQLLLLIDGAIVTAQVRGDKKAALRAKQMAQILLEACA